MNIKIPSMKKLLLLLLLFTGMVNAQIVNIPDAAFKAKLLESDVTNNIALDAANNQIKIDANNDGQIQVTEALSVYKLRVWNATIFNLTGISGFTNLTFLDCTNNILFNLDVSALTNLTGLICTGNYLTTLDVSAQPNLTQLSCDSNKLTSISGLGSTLGLLSCSNNLLTSIDLSNSPNIGLLFCNTNHISSLDVSGLTNLSALVCSANNLTSLNLSGLSNLQQLQCGYNQLTNLNLTGVTNLNFLDCFYNQLTNLDLSQSLALVSLNCGENNIATLNLNGLTQLNFLGCSYLPNNVVINGANLNALTGFEYTGQNTTLTLNGFPNADNITFNLTQPAITLNVSGLSNHTTLNLYQNNTSSLTINGIGTTFIEGVNCMNNQLTTLSLNGLNSIKTLNCGNNQLTALNLTGMTNLTYLDFGRNKITNIDLSGATQLKHLTCSDNKLMSLSVGGLPALEYLDCSNNSSVDINGNQIPALAISGLSQLKYLDCSNYNFNGQLGAHGNLITSLDVNGLMNMEQLKCSKNNIATLVVNGLTNLTYLDCSFNLLTSLDLIGLTDLTHLDYAHNMLNNLNMTGLVNITELNCSNNSIATLNVVDMPNLTSLICSYNALTTLNLSGLSLITHLYCDNNLLTGIDLSNMPNLIALNCSSNALISLEVNNLTNLMYLQCLGNTLTTIDVSALTNLSELNCSNNSLATLDVSTLVNLLSLGCDYNGLSTLDVNNSPMLRSLSCSNNALTNLDISNLANLEALDCNNNLLTSLNVITGNVMRGLYCSNNSITTLDVSALPILTDLRCSNNLLTTLFVKNGSNETLFDFSNNPTLTYICADTDQAESVQAQLNTLGMLSTVCNSYCSFSPGGPHNTVVGTTIFDGNNNGCNINDPLHPNIRIDITDTFNTGSAFTNTDGTCTFYTNTGNYTIFPNIENAGAFNISPASASITFPDNNNNVSNQSFCLSANGIHPDVEIVVTPVGPARPGFDAEYKIVYKNKGNQVLSGNIDLTFEDAKMDLISALPVEDSQAGGTLNWTYSSLLPFESRSIHLVFNVNSPTDTPPVNNDDILTFTTSVTPSVDDLPLDNQFTLGQIVVGPFDPNDKTCLEGDTVSSEEIGNYLHYTINFENLGTAEAVNVVVRDVIDTDTFDLSTLQVLYSSHDMQTSIRDNAVEFIFRNINLAPVAGDPPVGGHGTILFKIKTLPTLDSGSIAENTANIFFDYNAPVETNTARTTFALLSNTQFTYDESVMLYPNPAKNELNISCDTAIQSVELFDVQGRLIETAIDNKKQIKLDISGKAKGLYFVRISTEKGKKVEKVIKE
jgi:Leucine-rich repeat (LRR) protein